MRRRYDVACRLGTFIEPHLINMLKDMAFEVSKRKCKNSVGQMFSNESALVKKTLLK